MSSLFYYQGDGFFDGSSAWADEYINKIIKDDYLLNDENKIRNAFTRSTVNNRQVGWIPRLIYQTGRHDLTIGGEIRIHRSEHSARLLFAQSMPENYDMNYNFYSYNGKRNIYSLFIKDRYLLDSAWSLFGEIQIERHDFAIADEKIGNKYKYYTNITGAITGGKNKEIFSVPFIFVNPKIGLTYVYNEFLNIFAFIARTSREPRMQNLYNASDTYWNKELPNFKTINYNDSIRFDFNSPIAKPEKMTDFEIGTNYTLENFNISSNLYYMIYSDELVKAGKLDIWGRPIDENASKSTHYGLEMETSYKIKLSSESFCTLWGNTCLSQNYFNKYDVVLYDGTIISLKNNKISGFPDIMFNFGIDINLNNFLIGLTGKYLGEFYTDNYGAMLNTNEALKNDLLSRWEFYSDNINNSYTVFDLDISYTFNRILSLKHIKLQGRINSLFNEIYSYSGEGKEFFPAQERYFFFGVQIGL